MSRSIGILKLLPVRVSVHRLRLYVGISQEAALPLRLNPLQVRNHAHHDTVP